MNLSKWAWFIFALAVISKLTAILFFDSLYADARLYAFVLNIIFYTAFPIAVLFWLRDGIKHQLQIDGIKPLVTEELVEFIKKEMAKKESKEAITAKLRANGGWRDDQIADAYLTASQNLLPIPNEDVKLVPNGYYHLLTALLISLLFIIPDYLSYRSGQVNKEFNKQLLSDGVELLTDGDEYSAIEKFKQILATEKYYKIVSPTDALIGSAYYIAGDRPEGEKYCREAVLIYPDIIKETTSFSVCAEALSDDPQFANLIPEDDRGILEAQKYLREGKKEKAIATLDSVIQKTKSESNLTLAHLYLGAIYRDGHLDDSKANEHCTIGLDLYTRNKFNGFLNKDSNGNTVVDYCRMILNTQ